jgi:hypothetical protein
MPGESNEHKTAGAEKSILFTGWVGIVGIESARISGFRVHGFELFKITDNFGGVFIPLPLRVARGKESPNF